MYDAFSLIPANANFGIGFTLLILSMVMIMLYYAWFWICVYSSKVSKVGRHQPPMFPFGSLLYWHDLLKANKNILEDSGPNGNPVSQWLFHTEGFCVLRAEHVGAILKASTSRLSVRPHWLQWMALYHIKKFMGFNSVGVTDDEEWRNDRKAIGRSMTGNYIRSLYHEVISCVDEVDSFLKSKCEQNGGSTVIDISPIFSDLTLDVVCMAVFKQKLGALAGMKEGRHEEVVEAFEFASYEMTRRLGSLNPLDWMYGCCWREIQQKLNKARSVIRERINMVIEGRLKQGMKEEDNDLIKHLLQVRSNGKIGNRVPSTVIDNVITMMWAGHESTAATLSFAIYELSQRQYIQNALREEVISTRRKYETEIPPSVLMKLPILNSILWETLRFHSPALWTNRGLTRDLELENPDGSKIFLKKDTGVYFPIWAVHHSEANWHRPNEYLPSRFLEENITIGEEDVKRTHHKSALIPFGGGRRICPGHNLSPFEIKVILAELIQRFKFDPKVEGNHAHKPLIRANGMFNICVDNQILVTPITLNKDTKSGTDVPIKTNKKNE